MSNGLTGQALFESLLTPDALAEWQAVAPSDQAWFMSQCADAVWADANVPPLILDPLRVHAVEGQPSLVDVTPTGGLTVYNAHGEAYDLHDTQAAALKQILDTAAVGTPGTIPWAAGDSIDTLVVARRLTAAESMTVHGAFDRSRIDEP